MIISEAGIYLIDPIPGRVGDGKSYRYGGKPSLPKYGCRQLDYQCTGKQITSLFNN
jgi:hypothetical protein